MNLLKTKSMRGLLLTIFFALAARAGWGHSVWIEPLDNGQLVVRFAEPDGKFETSPGYLDNLSSPVSFILASNAPSAVETLKKSDHFLLPTAWKTNTSCVETVFTVRGGRKPYFYARWQPSGAGAGMPLLNLDLVPTGKAGEVKAWFRGKPLAGVKATLRTPDEKEQEITADDAGLLRFEAKQAGQYLLTIAHYREPLAGFFGGRSYEQTSHNAALSWREK